MEINIADEQLDDILDDTIQYFQERHYDGVIRTYLKYQHSPKMIFQRGKDYNPGISTSTGVYPATGDCSTQEQLDLPQVRFIENSNYILVPDWVIGVERVMTPPEATGGGSSGGGFYPTLGAGGAVPYAGYNSLGMGGFYGGDMISYYMAQMWRETYDFMFNPKSMIRFNKRQDRLYLDINWNRLGAGKVIIIDCYRALDPEHFCQIYNDSWVKKYLTASIKKQWGQNLIKFKGTKLPGGIEMNGREIYDDGVRELDQIKQDMSSTYELPPLDFVG